MSNRNLSVNFKYKFPENYNPIYANGVYGGGTPKQEIVINFFLERQPIPYSEIQIVNEKGQVVPTEIDENRSEMDIVRYVSTGVVLSLETAKDIHAWLGQHISQVETIKKGG